jgi:hypothetical protein
VGMNLRYGETKREAKGGSELAECLHGN